MQFLIIQLLITQGSSADDRGSNLIWATFMSTLNFVVWIFSVIKKIVVSLFSSTRKPAHQEPGSRCVYFVYGTVSYESGTSFFTNYCHWALECWVGNKHLTVEHGQMMLSGAYEGMGTSNSECPKIQHAAKSIP